MITQSPEFTLGLTPCFTPYGFWTCRITCLYLYSIMQRSFISLNPCALSVHPCPLPMPSPHPLIFFTVSTVLLFPEYHIFGILYYVASLDCLISLSNVHLKFFRAFLRLRAHFLKVVDNTPLYGCTPIYLLFLAMLCGILDLGSSARDWTHVLCIRSMESEPPYCQRSPSIHLSEDILVTNKFWQLWIELL